MTLRLAVFDVDGTLVDSQGHILAAMSHAFDIAGLAAPPHRDILEIVGLSLPEAFARMLPDTDAGQRARLVDGYKSAFREIRLGQSTASPLYPGVADGLAQLAARDDLVMGLATGKSRRGLRAMLDAHDMHTLFQTSHCADDHPSKPHPSMLLATLADCGVAAADAVMIGDTVYDIDMARAAGMRSIGVGWGYHTHERLRAAGADAIATDFPGVIVALDQFWTGDPA